MEPMAQRVAAARAVQLDRFGPDRATPNNSTMGAEDLCRHCILGTAGRQLLDNAFEKLGLSARAIDRVLKIAGTIARERHDSRVPPRQGDPVLQPGSEGDLVRPVLETAFQAIVSSKIYGSLAVGRIGHPGGISLRRIIIDVQEETVDIGRGHVLRGSWVTFYLALALRRLLPESPLLEDHELHLLEPWSLKLPESVGKVVSHHLDQLSKWGLQDLVVHGQKTKRWRLDLSPDEIAFRPSLDRCREWLEEKRLDPLDEIGKLPRFLIPWLEHTTGAIIHMVQGRIREGLELTEAAKAEAADWILLGAITELVEIRLRARKGDYPDLEEFPSLARYDDSIGRTLQVRAALAQSLEPVRMAQSCHNLILSLRGLPDINGLGNAYNALGVLYRRKGQYELAGKCLRYAAALLVASFDLPTLQAALFNLGHTLSKQSRNDQDLREALRLIELDRTIYQALGIGGDSAQAEVVAGAVCLKLGEIAAAERWLERGKEIAETLGSDYNTACVERLHARILWVTVWKRHQGVPRQARDSILSRYQTARDLLLQAGFDTKAIDDEIARFRGNERPKWLPFEGASFHPCENR